MRAQLLLLAWFSAVVSQDNMGYGDIDSNSDTADANSTEAPKASLLELCGICDFVVSYAISLGREGKPQEEILQTMLDICNMYPDSSFACKGVFHAFLGPILRVSSVLNITESPCSEVLFACGPPRAREDWQLSIPSTTPLPLPYQTKEGRRIKVLHLTDIHIDPEYLPGSEVLCTTNTAFSQFSLCCRADINRNTTIRPAGVWGEAEFCDIPLKTFESALKAIQTLAPFDYVMVSGDYAPHDLWNWTREKTKEIIINGIMKPMKEFLPDTPIYLTIGNHEGFPQEQFPSGEWKNGPDSPVWLYELLLEVMTPYVDQQQQAHIQKDLHMNHMQSFSYSAVDPVDPDAVVTWLIQELQESEQIGEKVHIMGHYPPGDTSCNQGWRTAFYKVVQRFENTIAEMFFGHTHADEYEVILSASGRAMSTGWVGPSMTTYGGVNPGFRIFEFDAQTPNASFHAVDVENYWTNLTEANTFNHEPKWKLLYNTKTAYQMKDLSPTSFLELSRRMENDSELLELYKSHYTRNGKGCDIECSSFLVCQTRIGQNGPLCTGNFSYLLL